MPTAGLDAFQLLVAAYLFYVAAKGSGTLYNFPTIPKKKQAEVRKNLRIVYAFGGLISLLDGAASMLQNSMFSVKESEAGVEIIQNYTIDVLPFITYDLLSKVSLGCTVIIVLMLFGVVIYTRKQRG